MKAIQATECGAPDVLKVETGLAVPEPMENQVLVNIRATGVNPLDVFYRSGAIPPPRMPFIPGCDAAGEVVKIGASVKRFTEGQRVFICTVFTENSGTYAEYVVVNEDEVHHLPDQLDFKQGASIGIPYFTAYLALFQIAKAQSGQVVLVHGASGGVGLAALQFCRQFGLTVFGTAGSVPGLELIQRQGAQQAFNHREEGYTDKIKAATTDKGIDIIIEMIANVNLRVDLDLIAKNGTIVVVGSRDDVTISPGVMMIKRAHVAGLLVEGSSQTEREEQASAVHAGIEGGWIKPVVYKEYPLEDAPTAHQEIMETKSALGKIVLIL